MPEQIVPVGFASIVTPAAPPALTDIFILFEEAGEPEIHDAFEVSTQVIASPFTNVVEEYVEFVAPDIITPFFFH